MNLSVSELNQAMELRAKLTATNQDHDQTLQKIQTGDLGPEDLKKNRIETVKNTPATVILGALDMAFERLSKHEQLERKIETLEKELKVCCCLTVLYFFVTLCLYRLSKRQMRTISFAVAPSSTPFEPRHTRRLRPALYCIRC